MDKKYLCIGGKIRAMDGDIHYINPYRLAELYKINSAECYFAKDDDDFILRGINAKKLIILYPKSDGNYKVQEKKRR